MMRLVTNGVAIVLGGLVGSACLLDLEHRIACGDGYLDREAGEQCEPELRATYENACRETIRPNGTAVCDPETCQILNDRIHCASCNDGVLDDDIIEGAKLEECDGSIIPAMCSTSGTMGCTSDCRLDDSKCEKCGNGVVDEGEECDPADVGGIAIPRACGGGDGLPALEGPPGFEFTSGTTVRCLKDCTYDRTGCGFCGNGELDDSQPTAISMLQVIPTSRPEDCDGAEFDLGELGAAFPACQDEDVAAVGNVDCAPDCQGFIPRAGEPMCCLPNGADCPADGTFPRCCHEYTEPTTDQHCSNPFLPPGEPPPMEGGGSKCN